MTTTPVVPAIDCPLSGAYLIEASAGTGKTWTLTGILLRLLIEKGVRPERMIATTFTRAAVQEMQERLQARLMDFLEVCLWAKEKFSHSTPDGTIFAMPTKERLALFDEYAKGLPALADPINQHLLNWVLDNWQWTGLDKALMRVRLVLASLDKLFIGTLDSLAQKWLSEFADDGVVYELIPDVSALVTDIIHDTLRAMNARLYHESPKLYACLDGKLLIDTEAMRARIGNALQFYGADIDPYPIIDEMYFEGFEARLSELLALGFDEFEALFDEAVLFELGASRASGVVSLTNNFAKLPMVLERLSTMGVMGFGALDEKEATLLGALSDKNVAGAFKKGTQGVAIWQALPLERLRALGALYEEFLGIGERFSDFLSAYVANTVRAKLSEQLKSDKKTSFALIMQKLLDALSGVTGERLARHIRHLYPVALIDEAQDVSGEQARLIERVYLSKDAQKSLFVDSDKGFVLLVGDPKQAIYRFRGGDVANYQYMKSLGVDSRFSLTVNRRSNAGLIHALNAWFGVGGEHGQQDEALTHLGEGIFYQKISPANDAYRLSWHVGDTDGVAALTGRTPLTLLRLSYQNPKDKAKTQTAKQESDAGGRSTPKVYGKADSFDALTATALHINTLLQSHATIYDKTCDGAPIVRALRPSDFAVLTPTNTKAEEMQKILRSFGIDAVVDGGESVFASRACRALFGLLSSALEPREDRLLGMVSEFFVLSLDEASAHLANEEARGQLMVFLKNLQKTWLGKGLIRALTEALTNPPFVGKPLWVHWAGFVGGERFLADMWQMIEVLSSWQVSPVQLLLALARQMTHDTKTLSISLPSESAVSVMTMHKAKGLEFAIVYVLGLDDKPQKSYPKLYPYMNGHERRLSATKARGSDKSYYETLDKQEEFDEKKRLGYVALTRASEQLFVVGADSHAKAAHPMQAWQWLPDGKSYALPERLLGLCEVIELDNLHEEGCFVYAPYDAPSELGQSVETDVQQAHKAWQEAYPNTAFYPEESLSFTKLSYLFGRTLPAIQSNEGALDEGAANDLADGLVGLSVKGQDMESDIRSHFMRGAGAGTFLHRVIEEACRLAPLSEQTNDHWQALLSSTIRTVATGMGLPLLDELIAPLAGWLSEVVHTPFVSSGVALMALPVGAWQTELAFTMSVKAHLSLGQLTDIFAEYGVFLPPVMSELQDEEAIFAYLVGAIDLVYEAGGRYFVVDYKSNFLAQTANDYTEEVIKNAMNEHGYWLQASIYQLALHRLLRLRIADYIGNENKYLGAVEFVFLRGVQADNPSTGRISWQVPLSLVQALDEFFGV